MDPPFLFVGCWNNPYNRAVERVIDAINADPIPTLVLGGDNIYPEKIPDPSGGKDKKKYNIAKLVAGIATIKGKKIYAALGNHNIDVAAVEAYELNDKPAYMYAPYKMGSGSGPRAPWIMPDYNYVVPFTGYNLVVIDTNAVEYPERLSVLLDWLRGVIEGAPYFLVQHEPYVSIRENKKAKGQIKVGALTNYNLLLDVIVTKPPMAILCADTHNYQYGTLTYNDVTIPQYIVGTGGAEPDSFPAGYGVPAEPFNEVPGVSYKLLEISSMYGYLRVTDGPRFEFVPVSPWSGGYRRTRKNRRKKRGSRRR
jgi:hypothetical protein